MKYTKDTKGESRTVQLRTGNCEMVIDDSRMGVAGVRILLALFMGMVKVCL